MEKDIIGLGRLYCLWFKSVWAGMSEGNKKKVVEGMTRVLEELGIPRDSEKYASP